MHHLWPVGPLTETSKESRLAVYEDRSAKLGKDQLDHSVHDKSPWLQSVFAKEMGLHFHFKITNTEIEY